MAPHVEHQAPPARDRLVVFLSYSRRDETIVKKVAKLGQAFGVVPWRDGDDISPGQVWMLEIALAVHHCERLLVFWCRHSSDSSEVRREYMEGLNASKRVVPVIMDKTPLAPQLKARQAVDVSSLLWWQHEIMRVERLSWVVVSVVGLLALIGLLK